MPASQENSAVHQRNAKAYQDGARYFINNRDIMHGQALAQFAGEQYFKYVHDHIENKAYRKDHDTLLQGMILRKNGSVSQPEQKNTGVKGIDQEAGGRQLEKIAGIELLYAGFGIGAQADFFEENIIHAQAYEEDAAYSADDPLVGHQCSDQRRKGIAQY